MIPLSHLPTLKSGLVVFKSNQLQQGPPPFAPYLFTDIVSNPIVEHLSITLLGKGNNGFYNGNTNSPGSTQQGLHMDAGHLWPNLTLLTLLFQ